MLLAKRRIPIAVMGLIALFALVLLATVYPVNAEDARDNLDTNPSAFEDGIPITGAATGWNWLSEGDLIKVGVFLGPALTNIGEIEVYIEPTTTGTQPVFSQAPTAGGVFATGVNIVFTGIVPNTRQITGQTDPIDASDVLPLVQGTTKVAIHLVDTPGTTGTDVRRSSAPLNTGLVDLTVQTAPITTERSIAEAISTPIPTPTATAVPAETGDITPGSGMLIAMMLAGLLLIGAGGVYLARPHRAK